jgi:DNA-binding MarR family transcriptional regulator
VDYEAAALQMMYAMTASPHHSPMSRFQRFSKGETFALNYLASKETALSAGDFCHVMQLSSARVAVMLRTLEEKGMIERQHDLHDRRRVAVTITGPGREFILKQRQEMHDHLVRTFRLMGPRDTKEFIRLSAKFFSIMSDHLCGDSE